MTARYQKGELSLFWAAVFVAIATLVVMVALMSARYERNYFSEAWDRLVKTDVGKAVDQTRQTVGAAAVRETSAVRQCTVDGKVVYSNVECGNSNPTSRTVQLHDSKGFEAPKATPVPEAEKKQDIREKMIEQAARR